MYHIYIAAILALLISVLINKYNESKKYRDINKLPGPPTVPFFGNSLGFAKNTAEFFENQQKLVKEYGLMVRLWLGSKPSIVVSDPVKLEFFLSSNEHISKSVGYNGFRLWLGDGLINSTGDHWRKHRKIITPSFHFKVLDQYTEYINSNSKILISKLKEQVDKKSIDIHPFINYYNLDVISETAMKTRINAQNNPKSDYVEAVKNYLRIYISRYFSFFKQYDFYFKLTEEYRLQQKYVKTLKDFTAQVIKKRKEERREAKKNDVNNKKIEEENDEEFGIKKKHAFLDMLLDLQDESNLLTDEEIREEVDTFMFSGHDTVSSTTCFCLLELSKRPEIQEKLVEESWDIMGDDKDANLEFKNVNDLKYLDLVVKETLRLRATVPFIERELHSDVTLDGTFIPKGTTITILPYALHHLEQFFPNPEQFDPDRFLPENSAGRHAFSYIPFSAGPRNCIGQKYALLSVKAAVIKILRNFEILPAEPKFEPILGNTAVLESMNGIHVQLKLRE